MGKTTFFTLYIAIAVLSVTSCAPVEDTSPVARETFSGVWKFHAGAGVDSAWQSIGYNDAAWNEVVTDKPLAGYNLKTEQGLGWYRKIITLPDEFYEAAVRKGGVILHLDSIAAADTLFVNGAQAGCFSPAQIAGGKFLERHYFVSSKKLKKGDNLIAIKFYDGWSPLGGGLLSGAQLSLSTAETKDKLAMDIAVADSDYIFMSPHPLSVTANIENTNAWAVKGDVVATITTDDYRFLRSDTLPLKIKANSVSSGTFDFQTPAPGFYRYTLAFVRNGDIQLETKVNVGFEPEKISSPIDAHDDFKEFWDNNLKRLALVNPEYKMTIVPESSNSDYNVYLVEMKSLDNKIIRGYYSQPVREGKFPVIVEYMGYGSTPYVSKTVWDGFAHYVPSIRGQGLNRLLPEDDFWITIGLKDKEGYYYQGGYCDVVRAIDFVCSRPEIDTEKIAVRGGSQGGALSFVAAALDKRVKVCAPNVPFLSDYRDYFSIVDWPRSDFDKYKIKNPDMDWEHVYDLLTYFDIKNLAQWIECPLLMAIGVQDGTCPPHINFAAYNQVKSEKYWVASPRAGHSIPDPEIWANERKFIREKLGLGPQE
ncbi:MAG: acetylxylan esterase [Tannerella sp.]|jgi:cephalosporin-C deacetylase-like acetyl esterase|nr:acetylxylan esterase [Tannerella sp.]